MFPRKTQRREAIAGRETKKAIVVLLRWVLIIVCSAMILLTEGGPQEKRIAHAVILLLICSNIMLATLPRAVFGAKYFDHCLVLIDLLLITGSIWVAGNLSSDLYLLYFFVIMIAAVGETLYVILWSASLVAVVYLLVVSSLSSGEVFLAPEYLIRVPFFFVIALFYGYFTQLVRKERTQKASYKRQLSTTQKVRDLSAQLSRTLDRKTILETLVHAICELCSVEFCAVVSRNRQMVLAQTAAKDETEVAPSAEDLFTILEERLFRKQSGSRSVFDSQQRAITIDPAFKKVTKTVPVRELLHFMPFTGNSDTDMYLVLHGEISEEAADRAALVLVSAVLALNNAGQYQALLHEVEKRQEVVKQLGAALEFKSEFVANISHEVRTPIYSFIGFAELLASGGYGEMNEEQEAAVKRMLQNAQQLLEMINNILDHTKMESGEFRVSCTQGDLESFVEGIAETCRPLVRDKPVSIHSTCSESTPTVVTDWCLLRQIALNLVSNAVKFTEQGRVEIEAGYDESSSAFFLNVSDTGVGIAEERLEEIFEPFRQLENSYTKRYAGTGLGLAITKKQIEMLGGEITVSSRENEGSLFSVVFPVKIELADSGIRKLFSSVIEEEPIHSPT